MSRCLQGDSLAWELFVRSYSRRISRLVSRYTRLRGEAEDLTQEVFLRVYLHLKTFRADGGKLSHWVARVGRNLIIDSLRMRNRRFIQFQSNEEPASLDLQSDRTPTPETSIVREETSRLVHRSLDMLPPELRQVLVMRYLEDLSHREISRRLRLPDGTIKSRIFRARARLAEVLGRSLM